MCKLLVASWWQLKGSDGHGSIALSALSCALGLRCISAGGALHLKLSSFWLLAKSEKACALFCWAPWSRWPRKCWPMVTALAFLSWWSWWRLWPVQDRVRDTSSFMVLLSIGSADGKSKPYTNLCSFASLRLFFVLFLVIWGQKLMFTDTHLFFSLLFGI